MKNLKKYVGVLMLLTLLVGFTSCEDDETIFDHIVGRTWVGDLGFWVDNSPVESGITDRKSTRLNSSHNRESRMPSSA